MAKKAKKLELGAMSNASSFRIIGERHQQGRHEPPEDYEDDVTSFKRAVEIALDYMSKKDIRNVAIIASNGVRADYTNIAKGPMRVVIQRYRSLDSLIKG